MNSSFHFPNFLEAYKTAKEAFPAPNHHDEPSRHGCPPALPSDSPVKQSRSESTRSFSTLVGAYGDTLPLNTVAA